MTYRMFIDDERFPPSDGNEWVICRNKAEVEHALNHRGFPAFISFDHDLGEQEPSGMDIAWMLVDRDLDSPVIPDNFEFYVHSQNSVGAVNIKKLLENYLARR
jgi:hypothetical protein